MSSYSGTWELVPDQSESYREKMEEATDARGRGMPGGMRGGGGGGVGRRGMPGGGMRGGMPGGGMMDPEEMGRAMEEIRRIATTPRSIGLNLMETAVSAVFDGSVPFQVEFDADPVSVFDGSRELIASAKWTKRGIELIRAIPNGGEVKDRIQLDEEGLLRVRREVTAIQGRSVVEVKMVYRRTETEG
jgi:hypothetical protein